MITISDIQSYTAVLAKQLDDNARFSIVEATCKQQFGHILFTSLRFDYGLGVMTRLYSNRQDVIPAAGTKPLPTGIWADQLITRGQSYIGYSKQDLREVFFDYEALWAIGCESVMNIPVIWGNQTIGSFNILGEENQYDRRTARDMSILAQFAAPCFITQK